MGAARSQASGKTSKMKRNANSENQNSDQNAGSSSSARPLSIKAPSVPQNQTEMPREQPRQPADLQGLLRFAMEATKSEDAPGESVYKEMDPEKRQFLSEALDSMTVNVAEEMQKLVKLLMNVVDLKIEDDPEQYEEALDKLSEWVDSMDLANDFYKIGGFSVFGFCLNSPHKGIRWRVANLIAELTQNNPFCQERLAEAGFMPILLNMIDSDSTALARVKALYAVSCMVRGNAEALKHMEANDGYSVLMRAIQSPIEKLQIKAAFLLSSLCNKDKGNDLKLNLIKMGLIEEAAGLLAMANLRPETREQLLNILGGLTNDNYFPALKECRRPELCLKPTLERHLQEAREEGSIEKENTCKDLIDKIFSEQ